jgi:hypothetical protein
MSSIQIQRFQWFSQPSFRQQNELRRERSKAAMADVQALGSAAADVFSNASANFAAGMSVIAAQRAAKRLNIPVAGATVNKSA